DPFSLLSREDSCVTLVITGPRVRVWGFWCKDRFGETRSRQYEVERFVPYYDWHDGGCGEPIEQGRVRADD
ncbi:hypothetical protein RBA15_22585, partial [Mycobacteroides abscessus subsp. massiliense]